MIKNFLHKGLYKFYTEGSLKGIQSMQQKCLRLILARLEVAYEPKDMNLPRFNFHELIGDKKGYYSLIVNKNWRVIFKFNGQDIYDVDYIDYH